MYYKNFEKLLEKNNIKPINVSRGTGIATSTLADWKNGKYTPKQEKLQKIADYFKVPIDFLIGKNEIKNEDEIVINVKNVADRRILNDTELEIFYILLEKIKKSE